MKSIAIFCLKNNMEKKAFNEINREHFFKFCIENAYVYYEYLKSF